MYPFFFKSLHIQSFLYACIVFTAGNVLTENVVSLEHQLGWQSLDNLREENGERLAYQRIWYKHHFIAF